MNNNQPTAAEVAGQLEEERKKWGYQVRLWQQLYYPLYGTLRGAQDIIDKPEQHEWLKRFIDEAVAKMEAVGAGSGPDFSPEAVHDGELAKARAEIERLRFALHAVGFALGGKDMTADDVDNECLRFNVGTALKYIINIEQGLDVFGRASSEKGGEG